MAQTVAQPAIIPPLAVPIVIQVCFTSAPPCGLNRWLGIEHGVAGPSEQIGASAFFELAVAAAIRLFGLHSGAALATVVGVRVEARLTLSLVAVVDRSRAWYEARARARPSPTR